MTGNREAAGNPVQGVGALQWWGVGAIFFVSGLVSLVYQVLWLKELGLLFGNTAQATATTLTAFFLGLAVGGWAGGKVSSRVTHPLRLYGVVELCVAAAALLYFVLLDAYSGLFPSVFASLSDQAAMLSLIKFLLGVGILFPAAFFMGATLPVLGQHMVRARARLGRGATALYAVNTLGAAVGAAAAGFLLPMLLGFDRTYLLAITVNVVLGVLALVLGFRVAPPESRNTDLADPPSALPLAPGTIKFLAGLTGFATLALEVLWTHMFAQVLHNSVYTFSIIVVTFLVALAGGSGLAHVLSRRGTSGGSAVVVLILLGAVLAAASPSLFHGLTGGLSYIADTQGWVGYQLRVFGLAGAVIFLPTLALGAVFPYLIKLSEGGSRSPGRTIGGLVAVNTAAAIFGSLAAAFVLLEIAGLWTGIRLIAALCLLGIPIAAAGERWAREIPLIPGVIVLGLFFCAPVLLPPVVKFNPEKERVLKIWQGSGGVVAVVETAESRRIKVDNHYSLGGTGDAELERRQGMIPLLLHPDPQDVFFLGMGTGITASAAMSGGVNTVTVCELVPDAIAAAREFFAPHTDGLFEDPRVRILAEDGRAYLRATREQFDVITADLFIPWKAGVGGLYTREHFENAGRRLKPGGMFAQWIPLFQTSRVEFDIIARTMLEVFPQVTMWRGAFNVASPIVALIGHKEAAPLDPDAVKQRLAGVDNPELLLAFEGDPGKLFDGFMLAYCGNLTQKSGMFSEARINTDDKPIIEYQAPRTQREIRTGDTTWIVKGDLVRLFEQICDSSDTMNDPFLSRLVERERGYIRVGYLLHRSKIEQDMGEIETQEATRQEMRDLLRDLATR